MSHYLGQASTHTSLYLVHTGCSANVFVLIRNLSNPSFLSVHINLESKDSHFWIGTFYVSVLDIIFYRSLDSV